MDPISVAASAIPYCNGKKLLAAIHKKVVLIHHGESVANAGFPTSDPASIPLTEDGRLQAEQIAEKMKIVPDLIIVSPLFAGEADCRTCYKTFPPGQSGMLAGGSGVHIPVPGKLCRNNNRRSEGKAIL